MQSLITTSNEKQLVSTHHLNEHLIKFVCYLGIRRSLHSPQGEGARVGRESQALHQRLHQELWRGALRTRPHRHVLQVWQDLLNQGM